MSSLLGRLLVLLGTLALLHAGYSTYEHISILKAIGKPETSIPFSIIIEAGVSFILFVPGIVLSASPLEDVTWRGETAKRSLEDADARMAFLPLGPEIRNQLKSTKPS